MTIGRVRVGDVLALQRRAVTVKADGMYEEIGLRSFGRGIFHKDPVPGTDLRTKRVFRIEPGDLVISNVFAWEGAIAVASDAESGKIGSHRFMTFIPRDGRVDAGWAAWFFRSEFGLELIRKASPGSAGRNRTLAIDRFESLEIPLLAIEEQQRVAARLDLFRVSADELTARSARASLLSNALRVSLASRPDQNDSEKARKGWREVRLGEVMTPAFDTVRVDPSCSYPNIGVYSFGRGLFSKQHIEGSRTSATVLNRVRRGQFIYSRLFAFEGAYAHVSDVFDGVFVSSEFPTFEPQPSRLNVKWLATYLGSPERWAELAGSSKGLGVRRRRIQAEALLAYKVWLPPMEVQDTIVTQLDLADQLSQRRTTAEHLARSLVPAALNQAFGNLS